MLRTTLLASVLAATFCLSASAQDSKPVPPASSTTPESTPTNAPAATTIILTDQERDAWVDKPVYSSDGRKIGEVVAFQRDPGNRVVGMHADIGGFLGMLQTRVNLTPAQFKLQVDRVVLELTEEQARSLPKVPS